MRCWIACCLLTFAFSTRAQRAVQQMDASWRFHRGDLTGAEAPGFSDEGWRSVDLPHDWSIEDLPGTDSPFNPDAVNGVSEGFTTGGTAWYRKTFTVPADSRRYSILFEGVYMDADVWLNGVHLGNHPYGYTSFTYDPGAALRLGKTNVLAVRVRNEGATSRWYPGSGIYRHVWLVATAPVHVAEWGTYVRTEGEEVRIGTTVCNQASGARTIRVMTRFLDPSGRQVAEADTSGVAIAAGDSVEVEQVVRVAHPELWSTERPAMYRAVTEVLQGERGVPVDRYVTPFGIRTISFDATHGFQLNGKPLKLKGGCFHDDHGPLGSKSYDRAEERRVQLLLASGYNAIRCSHNPPAPAFLDACDRLGLLVIDEVFDCWTDGKNPQDYHLYFNQWWQRDLGNMIIRDRNHPSIILWSIGNEIPNKDSARVATLAHTMAAWVHTLEPSRKVTAAVDGASVGKDPYIDALDVAGYNYADTWSNWYEEDHGRHPERVMFATESYPLEACKYWRSVEDHPYVVGDFVWTAWDYIGESSIGWRGYPQEKNFYPWNLAFCGDIDICGWKRPASFFRDALWHVGGDNISVFVEPPVPSFPVNPKRADWSRWHWFDVVSNWNWTGQPPVKVDVYATYPEAELFLNGRSLGRQPVHDCVSTWTVPYEPGMLKAVGYQGAMTGKTAVLETAGAPVTIRAKLDRSRIKNDGEDLSYITVEVLDDKGRRNPLSTNLMRFTISGPATIAGVGNGNPMSIESCQRPQRECWQGRCMVILRAGRTKGVARLTVSSDGLPSQTVDVTVE